MHLRPTVSGTALLNVRSQQRQRLPHACGHADAGGNGRSHSSSASLAFKTSGKMPSTLRIVEVCFVSHGQPKDDETDETFIFTMGLIYIHHGIDHRELRWFLLNDKSCGWRWLIMLVNWYIYIYTAFVSQCLNTGLYCLQCILLFVTVQRSMFVSDGQAIIVIVLWWWFTKFCCLSQHQNSAKMFSTYCFKDCWFVFCWQ